MAENNTRFRILCVFDVLMQNTDEDHVLSGDEIVKLLEDYGIKADKRAIASDIDIINRFSSCIVSVKKPKKGYYFAFTDGFASDYSLFVALSLSDYADQKNIKDFTEKIKRVGSHHRKRVLFDTESLVLDSPSVLKPNLHALVLIKYAIDSKSSVRLTLKNLPLSQYSDEFSDVTVEAFPRKILTYRKRQFLLFSDTDNSDALYFVPVTRINKAEESDAFHDLPDPDPSQAKDYFSGSSLFFESYKILLSFSLPQNLIDDACYVFGNSLSIRKYGNSYRASGEIQLDYSHIGWLVCNANDIKIISPDELKKKLLDFVNNL